MCLYIDFCNSTPKLHGYAITICFSKRPGTVFCAWIQFVLDCRVFQGLFRLQNFTARFSSHDSGMVMGIMEKLKTSSRRPAGALKARCSTRTMHAVQGQGRGNTYRPLILNFTRSNRIKRSMPNRKNSVHENDCCRGQGT